MQMIIKSAIKKEYQVIGKEIPRFDGFSKVTGRARYSGDIYIQGMLYGAVLSLNVPCANIVRMDAHNARQIPGVHTVLTAFDVAHKKAWSNHMYITDRPEFIGDCIAWAAAESKALAQKALSAIIIEFDSKAGIFSAEDAMAPDARCIHKDSPGNIHKESLFHIRKGNTQKGLEKSDHNIERSYSTQRQEHVYIEPEAVVAYENALQGQMVVHVSTQYPHFTRKYVADILEIPMNSVQIIQETVGGSFGGKEEGIGLLAARAAYLSRCTKRPVKMEYTREESIRYSSKRHPYKLNYKAGFNKDGKIVAWEGTQIADCGAYDNHIPFVSWRANIHSAGAYEIPNIKTDSFGVYTNNPFGGAFRGYSSPQILFAQEQFIDEIAEMLHMSPAALRLKNCLKENSITATGSSVHHVILGDMIKYTAEAAGFEEKYWSNKRQAKDKKRYRKGIGMAISHRGCGYGAESPDASGASIIINEDGSVLVDSGLAENGQGLSTVYIMIAAEALGVPVECVRFAGGNSQSACDSGLTAASRGTAAGAQSVRMAGETLNRIMCQNALDLRFFKEIDCANDICLANGYFYPIKNPENKVPFERVASGCRWNGKQSTVFAWYMPPELGLNHETGQGEAFHAYAYACVIAEVEVDMGTGYVDVVKVTASHDVGTAIHPSLIQGQVYGGIVMGQGFGITECLNVHKGIIQENNYDTYIIPTILDIPEMNVHIFECDDPNGTYGAKSIGEPAMECIAPAIANAVCNATGKRLRDGPLNLENVLLGERLMRR